MTTSGAAARTLILALVVTGVAACAPAAAPPKSYVLSASTPTAPSGARDGPVIAVGPVTVATYLDRSGIIVRRAGDEVAISTDHLWAEPLRDAVSRVLAENLSAMLATDAVAIFPWRTPWTPRFRVVVDIIRLDGPLGGAAVLSARWKVLDGNGKALTVKAVTLREAVTEPTYAGLVAAEGRLLATLSRDIAAEIRGHS